MNIPEHVAIILDGNGRWAKARLMPRSYGHAQGAKTLELICEKAYKLGVRYLTVYAFSTENWSRPSDEVEALMNLLKQYLKTCIKTAKKNNIRTRVIGDKSGLAPDIRKSIEELEAASADNDGLQLQIALNYGGRDELVRAVKKLLKEGTDADSITEKLISDSLDTAGLPDPDLLIRTGGELRVSNFLLWEIAYSELYVTDVLWPDFDEAELIKAIEAYNGRDRKFGGIKENGDENKGN